MEKSNLIDENVLYEFCFAIFSDIDSNCKVQNYFFTKNLCFENSAMRIKIFQLNNFVEISYKNGNDYFFKREFLKINTSQFKKISKIFNEKIICASIHFDNGTKHTSQLINIDIGYTVEGLNYYDIICKNRDVFQKFLRTESSYRSINYGFITTSNRFLTRVEAGKLAYINKQVKTKERLLLTEDLY